MWLVATMTKRPKIQPQDKYVLRLPDGLRDRIKAYADRRGTSMNYEIVRVLERQWPEQWPFAERLQYLSECMAILSAGRSDPRVDDLVRAFKETVEGVVSGRVTGVESETREAVQKMWETFSERMSEEERETAISEYDEEEAKTIELIGRPEKYAVPPFERKELGNYTDEEMKIFMQGYEAALKRQSQGKLDHDDDLNPFKE